jgi:L-rhamnose mutarotase
MESEKSQRVENGIKRVGIVIKLKPECVAKYRKLHADSNPGVRDLLNKYHIENFSIFLRQIDDEWFEFGYYEYTGVDFEADMAALAVEPRNQAWLKICDPMQLPLSGETGWAEMEQIYYNG